MTLALAIPMAWYLSATSRNATLRWACRVYILVGLVAVALTASRGGMLATMVALLIVPLTMTRLSPGRLAMAITVLAVSGAAAVAYVPTQIVERLATTGTEVEDMSLGGRFGIWKSGVRALTARPLTGYGTGMWRSAVSPWLGPNPQVAHNSFLSVAVETGSSACPSTSPCSSPCFRATQTSARRWSDDMPSSSWATLVVAMMPLSWDDQKAVWFILAALLGFAYATGTRMASAVPAVPPPRPAPVMRPVAARRGRDPYGRDPYVNAPRDINPDSAT